MELHTLGRTLLISGLLLAGVGLFLMLGPRVPFLGRLPGDIFIKKGNFTFYFPLVTCLVVSVLLTLLLRWFGPK